MFKDVCGVLLFYPSLPYFLRTFAVVSKLQHVWQTLRRCSCRLFRLERLEKRHGVCSIDCYCAGVVCRIIGFAVPLWHCVILFIDFLWFSIHHLISLWHCNSSHTHLRPGREQQWSCVRRCVSSHQATTSQSLMMNSKAKRPRQWRKPWQQSLALRLAVRDSRRDCMLKTVCMKSMMKF